MPVFAFTAGSLGDILATIGLTAQVVQVLYDHRNITRECDTLAMELQSLQQVLILTNLALKKFESTPISEPLVNFIRPEVAQCQLLLQQFSHKIESCRQALISTTISTLWRRVVWAASDEAASLSAKLSGHRLKLALLLMSLNSWVLSLNTRNNILTRPWLELDFWILGSLVSRKLNCLNQATHSLWNESKTIRSISSIL